MGDPNVQIRNEPHIGVTERFNEELVNKNGDILKTLYAEKNMRINNYLHNITTNDTRCKSNRATVSLIEMDYKAAMTFKTHCIHRFNIEPVVEQNTMQLSRNRLKE